MLISDCGGGGGGGGGGEEGGGEIEPDRWEERVVDGGEWWVVCLRWCSYFPNKDDLCHLIIQVTMKHNKAMC